MKQTIITPFTTGMKNVPAIKYKALIKVQCKVLICALLPLLFCCKQSAAQVGTWTPIATPSPHYNYGEMMLLTDGRVIAKSSSGGSDPFGNTWDVLTPDSHGSYVNGTWSSITPMNDTRLYFSGQVLPDGRVYVAGGEYGTGSSKGEVYNPKANSWTSAGAIPGQYFSDANSELLPSGKVLQAVVVDTVDGTPYLSLNTYLYDPATNTYTAGPETNGVDNESEWVKLPDNSILFCDRDLVTGLPTMTSERYIPSTNTWVVDAPVPVELFDLFGAEDGPAFLLPNGKVFFMGGASVTAIYTPSGSSSPGHWEVGPAVPDGLGAPDAAAAMMNNGKILFSLSPAPFGTESDQIFTDPVYFYEYDYVTNAFTQVPTPFGTDSADNSEEVSGTYITNMLDLPDGNVMFTFEGYDEYWIYTPTGHPLAAGRPAISNITKTDCTTYRVTGKLFNGISEGASYGDDWQMNTNYPIVRLTSGGNVYYATTSNWNRIGAVMTGSAPDTADFALPDGLPDATYSVVLIANGNPSAPYTITTSTHVITPAAATICVGKTIDLTDVAGGGIWHSSNDHVVIGHSTGIATALSPGTAIITDSFGVCVATATITVINRPYPISGTFNVCHGETTTLSSSPSGGAWSSSSSSHAAISAASGIVTGASAGSAVITYSLGGSCYTTADVSVIPPPSVALSDHSACPGSVVTMNTSPAYDSVVWSSGGTDVKTTQSPTAPSVVSIGTGDGLLEPAGTFVTAGGDLYVADFANGRVLRYPAGFTAATSGIVVAQSGLFDPYSVFVDESGNIYVGDGASGLVYEFPHGSTAATAGTVVGGAYGGFVGDIAVDHHGNVFVADVNEAWVLEFPVDSLTPVIVAEVPWSGYGICLGAHDTLYASDYYAEAVYKFTPYPSYGFGVYDGGVTIAGGNAEGSAANQFNGASGVFVDHSGNLYVTDNNNSRVQKFPNGSTSATNGVTVAGQGGTGSGTWQLSAPYHSHVDVSGNIYVADFGNNRVQVYYNVGHTSTNTTDTLIPGASGSYVATVTDIYGCSASSAPVTITAPACSISVTPGPGAYTGGVPATIYLGYGPETATLTATATGGSGFTYHWSSPSGTTNLSNTHIANPVFTATFPGNYTYTCTSTNSNGCSTTCTISVCVIDAVDHKIRGNVLLCHNGVTLSLPPSAVPSHLPAHTTDHLGACGDVCRDIAGRDAAGEEGAQAADELTVIAVPNPFTNDVHLKIQSNLRDNVDVTVFDVTGRVRETKTGQAVGSDVILGSSLVPGVYVVEVRQGEQSRKVKVVKY